MATAAAKNDAARVEVLRHEAQIRPGRVVGGSPRCGASLRMGRAVLVRLCGRQADLHGRGAYCLLVLPRDLSHEQLARAVPHELSRGRRGGPQGMPVGPDRVPDELPPALAVHGGLRPADGELYAGRADDRQELRARLPRSGPLGRCGVPPGHGPCLLPGCGRESARDVPQGLRQRRPRRCRRLRRHAPGVHRGVPGRLAERRLPRLIVAWRDGSTDLSGRSIRQCVDCTLGAAPRAWKYAAGHMASPLRFT